MLSEAQIHEFREKGYLRVGRVLTDEQLERLREGLDHVLAGQSAAQPELVRNLAGGDLYAESSTRVFAPNVVVQVVNMWEADEAYWQHIFHPVITTMAAQLIGCEVVRVWHDQIQYKPPKVGTMTGWHQDYPAWPILEPADLVTAWVALDDATIENGCMRMVPGSHQWGSLQNRLGTGENFEPLYDPAQLPEGAVVNPEPVEVKAGECSFHHCLTWHGSPTNPSDKPRRAIAVHYMPGYTRFVPKGRHVMDVRVEVQPGEILQGKYFPTVYDHGPLNPPPFNLHH